MQSKILQEKSKEASHFNVENQDLWTEVQE